MIKSVTQYVVVCDNSFCDSVVKSVVDFHSFDRRHQFEMKITKLGWKFQENDDRTEPQKIICPSCLLFTTELEKWSARVKPIRRTA